MATHELKSWPEFWDAVDRGDKTFEVRRDDRGIQVGDTLVLRRWMPDGTSAGRYVDRDGFLGDVTIDAKVVYKMPGGRWGLDPGWCVLGIRKVEAPDARHNIRPEVVPLIVEVLRESKQCKGVLSEGPGCYCFEGAVCEAYRRAHPGEAEWTMGLGGQTAFASTEGPRTRFYVECPSAVNEWATGTDEAVVFEGELATALNDLGHDFPWFIAALEAE